ncbi:AAA domain protein [Rickettsia hoogstraalii str. RCCE3]|nr:AAA domain protein [Rickettsia hoogstraalii str. RCCE3]
MTTIIYLIGKPGTGKYTIAKELSKSGYIICDNQLINNSIFALLEYDGFKDIPKFAWDAIGCIRDNVFDFITKEPLNNYVLTNVLEENEGDRKLFKQVENMALQRGFIFVPVKLVISKEENNKRVQSLDRALRYKSLRIESNAELINISHPHLLEIDVSDLTANVVAERILEHVILIKKVNYEQYKYS